MWIGSAKNTENIRPSDNLKITGTGVFTHATINSIGVGESCMYAPDAPFVS